MQDDAFIETLTVYETLYYSMCLRLPFSRSRDDGAEIIENILDTLNIRKVRDVQIGDPLKRYKMMVIVDFFQRNIRRREEKIKYRSGDGDFSFYYIY